MKRRELLTGVGGIALLTAVTPKVYAASDFKEGRDFVKLKVPAPVDAPKGKIEVIEFFAYTCGHCANFDPLFDEWRKKLPADVTVRREHIGFNKSFEPYQRIYYALEGMELVDKLHEKVFAAIQKERIALGKTDKLKEWITGQGVDEKRFFSLYDSFGVASKARRAVQLQDAYAIEGTPGVGVAGLYSSDSGMAKGFERLLSVVDSLLERERKSKKST